MPLSKTALTRPRSFTKNNDLCFHDDSLSYELNPWWSRIYSEGPEIRRYLEGVARKHGVLDQIELETRVETMTWDAEDAMWDVELSTGEVCAKVFCLGRE